MSVFTAVACLEPLPGRDPFSPLASLLGTPHTLPQPGRRRKVCRDMGVGAGPRGYLGGAGLALGVPADHVGLPDQELPGKTCLPTPGVGPFWATPVGDT